MKKRSKILLFLVLLILILVAILVIGVFKPFSGKSENEGNPSTQEKLSRIAEESEFIDFHQDTGECYFNHEIVVFAKESSTKEQIEAIARNYSAEVEDVMADIDIYKFVFQKPKTKAELNGMMKAMMANPLIEDASLNFITLHQQDSRKEDKEEKKEKNQPDIKQEPEETLEAQKPLYPDDPWNDDEWNTQTPRGENWGMEAIDAPGAWGYLNQMSKVKVGLIDDMPNLQHEDLIFEKHSPIFIDIVSGKVLQYGKAVPAEQHGSHVSGIMAATWNNKKGVSGVMGSAGELYFSNFFLIKQGEIQYGHGTAYTYLLTLKTLMDQDVQVINISLNTSRLIGFAASRGNKNAINHLKKLANFTEKGLSRIIKAREAEKRPDFVICVAAGNNNHIEYYPDEDAIFGYREKKTAWEHVKAKIGWKGEKGGALALYNNFLNMIETEAIKNRMLVVGAVGVDEDLSTDEETKYSYAPFSNVGERVDVVGPGSGIYSCDVTDYIVISGTSMATPHVAGVAGLIFASNPTLTGPQVKEILLASTQGRYFYEGGYSGLVNAHLAVINALKTQKKNVDEVIKKPKEKGLDLCFVVDTTGSMGDDIDNARQNMADILQQLKEKTEDYRVALIDYRDFPSRSLSSEDYASRVQLDFTTKDETITKAINELSLGFGGDEKETVYSALMSAVDLPWRKEAKKVIILLGDAAPLDPEPFTDYTYDQVALALFTTDIQIDEEKSDDQVMDSMESRLINVFSIGTDASSDAVEFFQEISRSTEGHYVNVKDASEVSDAIISSIEKIDVTKTLSVEVDFGVEMAKKKIGIYLGKDFLFTIETDDQGKFLLDSMEEDQYRWKSNGLYTSGNFVVEEGQTQITVRKDNKHWFLPILIQWREHRGKGMLVMLAVMVLSALFPIGLSYMLRRKKNKRNKKKQGLAEYRRVFCESCGTEFKSSDKYCAECGKALTKERD